MKEVVLTKAPYMNASEQRIADMHSVLNILNVVVGELSLIEPGQADLGERLEQLRAEFVDITRRIREGDGIHEVMRRIKGSQQTTLDFMHSALEHEAGRSASHNAEIKNSLVNLESVFSVLDARLSEFEERAKDPEVWVKMEPEAFRRNLEEVFAAVARNSKGKFGIRFDRAQQQKGDYLIDLEVEVRMSDQLLWIPLRLIDIFRDLTANARKYTPRGGLIALSLHQDQAGIRAVVEDNGHGIPEEEIEKVAEFGYRASNVRRRPTFGGGYGLTKAVWLVTNCGGSFTIKSEVDTGTKIEFSFPNADPTEHPKIWSASTPDSAK